MKAAETSYFDASRKRLVRRLGEPLYEHGRGGGRRGRVKALNELARASATRWGGAHRGGPWNFPGGKWCPGGCQRSRLERASAEG